MNAISATVESLESRRLLSAAVVDGVLVITGTPLAERILVNENFDPATRKTKTYNVSIDPVGSDRPTEYYIIPAEGVNSLRIVAGGGNDLVDLAIATYAVIAVVGIGPVRAATSIDAGSGNDEVYGGTARDSVNGGFGNDRIEGGYGDDSLNGGWGDDFLAGGNGTDLLYGSYGRDMLNGGEGDDRLYGGAGNDYLGIVGTMLPLLQEPGNDLLVGGLGDDSLAGGEGADRIYGGPGRDRFWTGDSPTEMRDRTPDEPIGPVRMPVS